MKHNGRRWAHCLRYFTKSHNQQQKKSKQYLKNCKKVTADLLGGRLVCRFASLLSLGSQVSVLPQSSHVKRVSQTIAWGRIECNFNTQWYPPQITVLLKKIILRGFHCILNDCKPFAPFISVVLQAKEASHKVFEIAWGVKNRSKHPSPCLDPLDKQPLLSSLSADDWRTPSG